MRHGHKRRRSQQISTHDTGVWAALDTDRPTSVGEDNLLAQLGGTRYRTSLIGYALRQRKVPKRSQVITLGMELKPRNDDVAEAEAVVFAGGKMCGGRSCRIPPERSSPGTASKGEPELTTLRLEVGPAHVLSKAWRGYRRGSFQVVGAGLVPGAGQDDRCQPCGF